MCESVRRIRASPPTVESFGFVARVSLRELERLRERERSVICLPTFQVVSMSPSQPCSDVSGDERTVFFEIDGVSLCPILRQTARGCSSVLGMRVLMPFTLLEVRRVLLGDRGIRVVLSEPKSEGVGAVADGSVID
jgi:hypothetical protein